MVAKIRRIPALLLALALAGGLVVHGFAGPEMALNSTITAKSIVAASGDMPMSTDMPMPGKCNGCAGDEKGVAPSACSAFCATVISLPSVALVLDVVPAETLDPATALHSTGHADPPDPYPPRPSILS
jgi:hypothetical protein